MKNFESCILYPFFFAPFVAVTLRLVESYAFVFLSLLYIYTRTLYTIKSLSTLNYISGIFVERYQLS
jgi:hypothetical protein